MKGQKQIHPRFIVPKKYRKKLANEYNYFQEFEDNVTDTENEHNQIQDDEVDCIICMTSLRYEVTNSEAQH